MGRFRELFEFFSMLSRDVALVGLLFALAAGTVRDISFSLPSVSKIVIPSNLLLLSREITISYWLFDLGSVTVPTKERIGWTAGELNGFGGP